MKITVVTGAAMAALFAFLLHTPAAIAQNAQAGAAGFTMEQVKGLPFPNELTAAASGQKLAWAFNEQGRRNVWVAESEDWTASGTRRRFGRPNHPPTCAPGPVGAARQTSW